MPKLRVAGNRLSLGSWSIPIKISPNWTESKRQRRNFSAMAAPAVKNIEFETESEENVAKANGVPSKETTENGIVKPEVAKSSTTNMIELAAIITRETEKLEKYLKESGSSMPGFDVESPANFPKLPDEIKRAREEVVRASKELSDLVTGPTESIRWMAWDVSVPITRSEHVLTEHSTTTLFLFRLSTTTRLVCLL
jgi:hypothetical protein